MEEKIHVHKVGTITFGSLLVIFGILFLVHIFFPVLTYSIIFRLWPCIFILLGVEVLVGALKEKKDGEQIKFIYDKGAVVLIVIMTLFAMCMAGFDIALAHTGFLY